MLNKKTKGIDLKTLKIQFLVTKRKLPLRLANTIQNHFLMGFRRGGGSTNTSTGGWEPRKTSRSARERKRSVGRAILVRSGKLRADIRKRKVRFSNVTVGTNAIPYAGFLNDGTPRMKQREFIGESRVLDVKIERKINKELKNLFKL